MRFIVKDKLYDTDKAELLCTFSKQWKSETILGTLYPYIRPLKVLILSRPPLTMVKIISKWLKK